MTHEELSNKELLILFKQAAQELNFNSDQAEEWFAELEAEVLSRMDSNLDHDVEPTERGF